MLWFPYITLEANEECSKYHGRIEYSQLYLKLEEDLFTKNAEKLEALRASFIISNTDSMKFFYDFQVRVAVMNGTGIESIDTTCNEKVFCSVHVFNTSEVIWTICDGSMHLDLQESSESSGPYYLHFTSWMSFLHGNLLSMFILFGTLEYNNSNFYSYHDHMDFTFMIERLDWNPCPQMMKCVLLDLFSWVCLWFIIIMYVINMF